VKGITVVSVGRLSDDRWQTRCITRTMLFDDLRHGLRLVRREPGFAAATAFVFALGIGAATATFTVVHAVIVRPLPFDHPERILRIWSSQPERDLPFFSVSAADLADWRAGSTSFDHLAAYERQEAATLSGDEPQQVLVVRASRNLLPVLGVPPALGRWFSQEEDAAGAGAHVAVISHQLWQQRFGGRRDVIGQNLRLNEEAWGVIGVMPPSFEIPNTRSEVWVPLQLAPQTAERSRRYLRVIGRLREGHSIEAATADLKNIARELSARYPASNRGWTVAVRTLHETVVGADVRRRLLLVSGGVGLVLVIACVNVGGLLVARAGRRARELLVRMALGAKRRTLVLQLFVESLVLAFIGGTIGVILAMWSVDALAAYAAATLPRANHLELEPAVMAFAGAVMALAAVLSGIAPVLLLRLQRFDVLKGTKSSDDRQTTRAQDALVIGEVALATILVVCAALLVQSLMRLQQRDLGFEPGQLLLVDVVPPPSTTPQAFHTILSAELKSLPGVLTVAGGSSLPFAGGNPGNILSVEGRTYGPGEAPDADIRVITPEYFDALGIPIVRGRPFTSEDGDHARAVVVSATLARRQFAGEDPLGKRIQLGGGPWLTIVGIAADVRYYELDAPDSGLRPMAYVLPVSDPERQLTVAIRTAVAPATLVPAVRDRARRVAPAQPIARLETMNDVLALARGPQRFSTAVLASFAWVALALAVTGLWALVDQRVVRRRREIGIRVALGARPNEILRMVAGRGLGLAGAGILAGTLMALLLRRPLQHVLFDVSATDPATLGVSVLVFFVVAGLSSVLPARRALRVDPVEALRAE
jgi:predicted permease